MASIIKNQILKHLSRFTKNLSANNIHLDTFKGEGTLKCLELDENVLTELLELPVWMKLTNAWCNSVAFQIQWTKLKSVPIHLTLDQVTIEIETCEELRSASVQGLSSYMQAPGKYSFIHKVIDGISIAVNTTEIIFRSPAFVASVAMLKILVESKTPEWKKDDLTKTRLKDADRGQILIFKELQWQNVRIEAKSITEEDLPPLRLITDKASCRITIKKRLADCFIVGSRLVLNLDTVLWVLTDSQLKAALHFLDSLSGLIQKSSEVTRKKTAARKLEELPEYRAQLAQQARVDTASNTKTLFFSRHDVIETSYHFLSNNIDLHLSDDPDDHFSHPDLKNGGSLQINLVGFKVDFYPYHLAGGDRRHWPKYSEADSPHTQWLNSALNCFKSALLDIIESPKTPHHSPLARTSADDPTGLKSGDINKGPVSSNNKIKAYLKDQFAKLMTTCIILRIADFNVFKVPTKKRSNFVAREFVKGDKDYHKFPAEMAVVHAEFTYFYYPGDIQFPLPSPKFYVHANPILVYFDVLTVLWLNTFLLNLHQSLLTTETANQESTAALIYFDVIVEAIMPRLVFESSHETSGQRDRPKSLHFHVSRLSLTNTRSPDRGSSRADLAKCIHAYQLGSLYYGVDFPSCASDFHVITEKFMDHVEGKDNVRDVPQISASSDSIEEVLQVLKQDFLWTEAKDVWCVRLEPVWGDFYGVRAIGTNKPVPFLDAVPVTLWAHSKSLLPQSSPVSNGASNEEKTADLHAIACVSSLVSAQINHYQLLFLMRLAEDFGELTTFLAVDTKKITNETSSIVLGAILPQLEVTFVMQSQQPGKESTSGGDLESSVVPDSSSLVDDGTAVSSSTANVHWNSFHNSTQANGCLKEMDIKLAFAKDRVNSDFQSSRIEEISNLVKDVVTRDSAKSVLKKQGSSFFPTPVKTAESPGAKKNLMGDNNISKKWSSLMESFKQTPVDDLSDSASIRSDSDNSDSYVFLKACNEKDGFADDQFNFGGDCRVEMACEALDDDDDITPLTTPPSERDSLASSYKRKDLVSTATFKLGQVEFLQQSEGFHSAIKIQVTNVAVDECPSIPWDEFQSKFSTRSRDWIEIERQPGGQPCVKLRLNHEIKGNNIEKWTKSTAHQWASDHVTLRLSNISLTVSASTLGGIGDLVEDEIIPQPLPLEVDIENIKLHLIEERSLGNITSPEPIPVDLLVCRLRIRRGADGVFCIEPFDARTVNRFINSASTLSNSLSDENSVKQSEMKREIEQLRRRLAAMESLNEENHQLRKYQEETQTLRSFLNAAQQDVMTLLEEKRKLLELVESLQGLHGTESSFSKR